ncbi:hypothetical protein PI125_g23537 [Phytophthora idaei]|nr:hypothetical protein PI125_g23537 [Phytophthora idaei]
MCSRGVHHICSNELYDAGRLSERFCIASCLYQWKTVASPPSASAGSVPEAHEVVPTLSQASQLSDSDVCLFPLGQSTQPMSPSLSAASVVDLTAASTASGDSSGLSTSSLSSSASLGVAAFGVPLEVCHFRQQNLRHDVWDVARRLAIPSTKTTGQDAKPFTHVYLLCAQQLTCNPFAEPDAWEGGLHRWGNTPNARSLMMALHEDHPLEKAEASLKSKAAARHVGEVMERANSREQKRTIPVTTSDPDWCLVTEMEAIVCSIADLARVEVQRKELVSSELIVLLKFASDRLNSSKFSVCDLDAPRTPTTTVGSFQRDAVAAEDLGPLARTCLARMIGQVEQRIATATPETVLILLLDPSTKFSVASLIRPSKRAKAKADEEDGADKIADDRTKQTIAEGNKLLVDVHREILCSLNARFSSASQAATAITSPNLDLIPCVDNGEAICGAAIPMTTPGATPFLTLHDQADKVL